MRVLLTGAGGMLGSGIADAWARLRPAEELISVTRREVDLRDDRAVTTLMQDVRPDAVIHAAAVVGGIAAKIAEPTPYLLENLALDSSVLRASLEVGVPELLYIGSAAIYPESAEQPIAEDAILTGTLEPANEGYALAKIAAGKVCEYASRQFGYAYRVAAPSNLYGPGDDFALGHGHLVAAAIAKVHAAKTAGDRTVSIWGDGRARREFTFSVDLAEWLVGQVGALSGWPSLLNLGTGDDHSITEYYEVAREVVGWDGEFVFDASKPSGVGRRLLDSSRARALGWNPSTPLTDGMRSSYESFLAASTPNGTK
ncbi:NAD-dependent epimerase/dehydratase family protein [Leifsonia sp. EB34]|uniref:NAD-dependent epimerase/dehydratase family protein n=1 Tax=Leifsonia sp. EB34 TaxID=3156303 RepID=UPI0035122300